MIDALIVSNVLLWIAVLVLAGVVLALLRQIGVLHERVARQLELSEVRLAARRALHVSQHG